MRLDKEIWVLALDLVGVVFSSLCVLWGQGLSQEVCIRGLISCLVFSLAVFLLLKFYRRSTLFSAEGAMEIIVSVLMLELLIAPAGMLGRFLLGPFWICVHALCMGIFFLMTQGAVNFFSSHQD